MVRVARKEEGAGGVHELELLYIAVSVAGHSELAALNSRMLLARALLNGGSHCTAIYTNHPFGATEGKRRKKATAINRVQQWCTQLKTTPWQAHLSGLTSGKALKRTVLKWAHHRSLHSAGCSL